MEQEKNVEEIMRENINLWFRLLKEKNIEAMTDLYAEPCLFLPTLSDKVITDKKGVREYFEHFMALDPKGKLVSNDKGGALTDGIYVSGAKYDFETPGGVVNARYDMTWVRENGKWLIRVHHSSPVPKPENH